MSKSKYIKWSGMDLHRTGFALDNYAGKAGEYPDTLILGSGNYKHVKENLLTEEGFEKLSQRITIVVDDSTEHSDFLIACSGAKGYYCYNSGEFEPRNGETATENLINSEFLPHMKRYGLEE